MIKDPKYSNINYTFCYENSRIIWFSCQQVPKIKMQGFLLKKSLPHLLKYNPSFTCTEVHLIAVDFFFFALQI